MINFLVVGFGGFTGAALRYAISVFMVSKAGLHSAWGTFAVNLIGCFLIGILAGFEFKNLQPLKLFLITGLLGGFTTFSAFGLDSVSMLKNGEVLKAVFYVCTTLFCGIISVYAGFWLSKIMR